MSKGSEAVKRWRRRHPSRARDADRVAQARRFGYAPPAIREADGPAPPKDDCCELCRRHVPASRVVHPQGLPEGSLRRRLHRDHDHTTGAHRGWICYRCNVTIGNLEAMGIETVVAYIKGQLPWQ